MYEVYDDDVTGTVDDEYMMMMSLDDDLPVLEVVVAPDQFPLHTRSPDQ